MRGEDEASLPRAGRLLGLDLGAARIGVAVSDSAQQIALAHEVLRRSGDPSADRVAIAELVAEFGAIGVVVGLPRSLSGALGPAAIGALAEVTALRAVLEVPVVTVDERFSTVEATRRRQETGTSRRRRRRPIDDVAAAVLLQGFLDRAQHRRSMSS